MQTLSKEVQSVAGWWRGPQKGRLRKRRILGLDKQTIMIIMGKELVFVLGTLYKKKTAQLSFVN